MPFGHRHISRKMDGSPSRRPNCLHPSHGARKRRSFFASVFRWSASKRIPHLIPTTALLNSAPSTPAATNVSRPKSPLVISSRHRAARIQSTSCRLLHAYRRRSLSLRTIRPVILRRFCAPSATKKFKFSPPPARTGITDSAMLPGPSSAADGERSSQRTLYARCCFAPVLMK